MAKLMKGDLVSNVAEQTGLGKKAANAAVDAVVATIQGALSNGDSVALIGFGTFEVRTRSARRGRNLHTGETMDIPAKKVPAFKAGKKLRDAVA